MRETRRRGLSSEAGASSCAGCRSRRRPCPMRCGARVGGPARHRRRWTTTSRQCDPPTRRQPRCSVGDVTLVGRGPGLESTYDGCARGSSPQHLRRHTEPSGSGA
jgi:hypothetical protein